MVITEAAFVKSSPKWQDCPAAHIPEYAFVGRSNVGKSSLLNMLTGRRDLAKTSGKPGKTQLINHFSVRTALSGKAVAWYLVDLPGYGYAKVSKAMKARFQALIHPYLANRSNLVCTFVLIDIRHEPQPIDLQFMEWLGVKGVPFAMVFTKADKLKKGTTDEIIRAYNEVMLQTWEELPAQFVSSSALGEGRDSILSFIESCNADYRNESN